MVESKKEGGAPPTLLVWPDHHRHCHHLKVLYISTTMKNLEALVWKLVQFWPFWIFIIFIIIITIIIIFHNFHNHHYNHHRHHLLVLYIWCTDAIPSHFILWSDPKSMFSNNYNSVITQSIIEKHLVSLNFQQKIFWGFSKNYLKIVDF